MAVVDENFTIWIEYGSDIMWKHAKIALTFSQGRARMKRRHHESRVNIDAFDNA